jgi:DNA-directed RNA polymerase specialized sigma24 family protein
VAKIPTTSTTLLRDVANDSQHARWGEFVARYRPAMEAFMRVRFPSLDADDVIQETLVAVWAWNWPQTHKRLWMIAIWCCTY